MEQAEPLLVRAFGLSRNELLDLHILEHGQDKVWFADATVQE